MIEEVRQSGVSLVGPDGLLAGVPRSVLQAGLDAELSEHLGYGKGDRAAGRGSGNARNGSSPKAVRTEVGPVQLAVPRDRQGTFEPQIVPEHAPPGRGLRRGDHQPVAKGLTTGEIAAHLARDLLHPSLPRVDLQGDRQGRRRARHLANRPLDRVYPVVFIDVIHVRIRDGQVANRPIYVVLGINCDGERDMLGLWVGTGGEGAKH